MEDTQQIIEIHITPIHRRFYSDDNNYGIYSASLVVDSPNKDKIQTDTYGELNIVGSMPMLEIGKKYIVQVVETTHPKFGLQYTTKSIYRKPLESRDEQIAFLGTIITQKQLESLIDAYPTENIVSLITKDELNVDLVKGIGEVTLAKIKDKIKENEKYQSALVELTSKFDVPYNAVRRLTDKYGSPDILLQKVKDNPYILTEVDGFGFIRVDEIALKMGVEKISEHRIISCIEYVLEEQANNGHCWIKRNKLLADSVKLLNVKIADVEKVLEKNKENTVFNVHDDKAFLYKYFLYEAKTSFHLKRILSSKGSYTIDHDKVQEVIKRIEEEQGFAFTEEQLKAIHYGLNENVLVVNGKAGTGKTSVIKGVVAVLKECLMKDAENVNILDATDEKVLEDFIPRLDGDLLHENPTSTTSIEYATCALSGKASQRIQESTGLYSSTIHRLLGFNPMLGGWLYNEDNPMSYDIIILDEGSMVNSELYFYLVRAIKNGAKLIIAGDTAQLEPIGVGNVLVDLLESINIPSVELTMVHRQAQKSGILSCANMVRDGISFVEKDDYSNKKLGELQDLYLYPYNDSDTVFNTVIKIAKKYNGDIMDFQVIVPMKSRGNLSTQNINNELQVIFNQAPDDVEDKRKLKRKNYTFLEGDKVIINGNNYDKNVFNGTLGIIEYIDSTSEKGEIVIDFEGVGRLQFTKEEMNKIDLAYALTVHKTQGSQFKYVVFALDYASYILLNRQLVYTGMTRAVQSLFMPVELRALLHAIKTDNSSKRNTFLLDLLDRDAE